MRRVFAVTLFALRAVRDEMLSLAGMGAIWFAIAIAVPYGLTWLARQARSPALFAFALALALIPVPPITGALYDVASHIAREKPYSYRTFWRAFRVGFGLSWKVGGTILLSGAILALDVYFYLNAGSLAFTVIGFLGLLALVFWAAIQIYLYPMAFALEEPSLRQALRNAALLALAYPLFTLGIALVTLLATALSVLLVAILVVTLWMPFLAVLHCRATQSALQKVKRYREGMIKGDK